jgi:glycosyltransferase involved in cell wall biosynthesis
VEGKEKLGCLREASVFCFLSHSEGMPLAVLEALAMGLPLVSSDAGGLKDILSDGEHGVLLTPSPSDPQGRRFDPAAVACAIARLADDPETSRAIGLHNASYARDRFSPRKVARNLDTIYRSVRGKTSPVR